LEAEEIKRATISRAGALTEGYQYLGPGYGFD
jgi:hypothetical protein